MIAKKKPFITAHILPSSSDVSFALLEPEEIQSLADLYGHFQYIPVGVGQAAAGSITIDVATTWTRDGSVASCVISQKAV